MANISKDNPFTPGAGRTPPLLAGREEETELLDLVLDRLVRPRVARGRLKLPPFPPVRIVAPPGGGRRALLAWIEREALRRGIHVARSSCPEPARHPNDQGEGPAPPIMATMVDKKSGWKDGGVPAIDLVQSLPARKRFLLIVDDVQNYSLKSIDPLLFISQEPISEGHPFALVLAGTPMMDMCLLWCKAGFIVRSDYIYIGALSDAATREALRAPFEQAGVAVTSDALEELAAQTGNYPYFIQLAGAAAWEAMAATGRRDIDAELVRQSKAKALEGREDLYRPCYERLREQGLLPYARRVIEMLDRNGGRVSEKAVLDLLRRASGGEEGRQILQLYGALQEGGLIWIEDGEAKAGIPSLLNYCNTKGRKGDPPSSGGFPRSWLPGFLPGFFLPKKPG